jgi:hypothetical protein
MLVDGAPRAYVSFLCVANSNFDFSYLRRSEEDERCDPVLRRRALLFVVSWEQQIPRSKKSVIESHCVPVAARE